MTRRIAKTCPWLLSESARNKSPDKGLLVDDRGFLKHLEVVLLVTGVLIQDEQIRAQKADHESQVKLPDHTHLSKVLLRGGEQGETQPHREGIQ